MVGETFRHVEQSFDEGSADIAEFPAVEPYVRPIVNAFEIQPHTTPGDIGRLVETDPVPPLRATEAFGNGHVVQPVVRIGIDAGIDQCGQHRSRHHRIIPPGSIVCRAEERASLGHDPIGIGHFPTAGQCPGGVIRLFETHFDRPLGFGNRLLGRRLGFRKLRLGLRNDQSEIGRRQRLRRLLRLRILGKAWQVRCSNA